MYKICERGRFEALTLVCSYKVKISEEENISLDERTKQISGFKRKQKQKRTFHFLTFESSDESSFRDTV